MAEVVQQIVAGRARPAARELDHDHHDHDLADRELRSSCAAWGGRERPDQAEEGGRRSDRWLVEPRRRGGRDQSERTRQPREQVHGQDMDRPGDAFELDAEKPYDEDGDGDVISTSAVKKTVNSVQGDRAGEQGRRGAGPRCSRR
jgi:hypothetical protein